VNTVALTLRQARYEVLAFRRNPASVFFTFIFPIMFLVIFNLVFGHGDIQTASGTVDTSTFYVPAIVALGVISACYTNIAMSISFARDRGQLKRMRGTPLPAISYLLGRIIQATIVALILVVLVLALGVLFYNVDLPDTRLPAFIVALIIGAITFCSLGLAVTSLIPNADAAPAVVNASILPLLFISDVFIPTENAPGWLNSFASIFPVVHFADALHAAFDPFETGSGFDATGIAVMIAWAVIGIALSVRYFSWEPRR
jgi:ABC-2 type transport system permease protein